MKNLFIATLVIASLAACNTSGERKNKTVKAPAPANTFTPGAAGQSQGQPAQSNTSTAGVNPAHGEPGHRCDIAVGAPLNSAATSTPTISTPIINTAPATNQLPQKNTGSAKLNPPHGEPGHDCSVQVGQPLRS